MSFRNFLRRNIVADDPQPELSTLDRLDLERSMTDHPAGKRRPAVRPVDTGGVTGAEFAEILRSNAATLFGRPAPESIEEALSDDDLFAVARGAGVVREARVDPVATAAMRHYRETNDLDGALAIFAGRDAS